MVQKTYDIEYQEVSSKLLHNDLMQNRCKSGAKLQLVRENKPLSLTDRIAEKVNDPVFQNKVISITLPVVKWILYASFASAVLFLIGWILYKAIMSIGVAISYASRVVVESGILWYIGLGLLLLLIYLLARLVSREIKSAVPFDDYKKSEPTDSGVNIIHNHYYNIDK